MKNYNFSVSPCSSSVIVTHDSGVIIFLFYCLFILIIFPHYTVIPTILTRMTQTCNMRHKTATVSFATPSVQKNEEKRHKNGINYLIIKYFILYFLYIQCRECITTVDWIGRTMYHNIKKDTKCKNNKKLKHLKQKKKFSFLLDEHKKGHEMTQTYRKGDKTCDLPELLDCPFY